MIHTPPIMEDTEGESNGGRAHSISTPSSGDAGLDGDITRYTSDFFPLSALSHHSSASPDSELHHQQQRQQQSHHQQQQQRQQPPMFSLDSLKLPAFGGDVGIKPSDIDFGDPSRSERNGL